MKNEEWLSFEWPGYHIYQAIAPMKAWFYDFKKFDCPISKLAVSYEKGTTGFHLLKKEYEGNGKKFFRKIKENPKIMFKVLAEAESVAKEIFKLENKWRNKNYEKLSDNDLMKLHSELFKWDEILWRKGQIQNLLEFHNNYLTEYVKQLIIRKFGEKKEVDIFNNLTVSRYQTKSEKQDYDFAKLVKKVRKNKNEKFRKGLINRHYKKYAWMSYGWTGPALDLKYFLGNVDAALKNKKIIFVIFKKEKERKKSLKKQALILKKFGGKEKELVELLRKLLEAKAVRVDAHSLTYCLADKIRGELAKRFFLSINQTRVIAPEDIRKIGKFNPDVLNKEYVLSLYWLEKKKKIIKLIGEKAHRKLQYIRSHQPKVKKTDLIRGEMAYPGKVKGNVKLILEANEFKKFGKGEILVTRITDPSYLPIMKISKAIITDIGGITCHAAIVSRELRKPCIIGTKVATKVLCDGQLVEVDANKGIVKIIK